MDLFTKRISGPKIENLNCPLSTDVGKSYYCKFDIEDPDSSEVMVGFDAASHTCGEWLKLNPNSAELFGTADKKDIGDCVIGIRVENGKKVHIAKIPFKVGNPEPQLNFSKCKKVAHVNKPYSCKASVSDPDNEVFIFSLDGFSNTCGKWLTIESQSGVLRGTPNNSDIGRCIASVIVSDGKNNTKDQIIIDVKK